MGGSSMGHSQVSGAFNNSAGVSRPSALTFPMTIKRIVLEDIMPEVYLADNFYRATGTVAALLDPQTIAQQRQALEGRKISVEICFDPKKLPDCSTLFHKDDRKKPVEFEEIVFSGYVQNVLSGKMSGVTLKNIVVKVDRASCYTRTGGTTVTGSIIYVDDRLNGLAALQMDGRRVFVETNFPLNMLKDTHVFDRVFIQYPSMAGGTLYANDLRATNSSAIVEADPVDIMELIRLSATGGLVPKPVKKDDESPNSP